MKYDEVDKHQPGFEMNKQGDRDINCEGITKEEGDVDGDNLLINPDKPDKHLGTVDFGKMIGRPEEENT